MQLARSAGPAEELLAHEEATSKATAKKAEKQCQQKLKKQQAKQLQQQSESVEAESGLQEPSVSPTTVAEEATLGMLAEMSVSRQNPYSHQQDGDLAVPSEQAAATSGTTGSAEGAFSSLSGSAEQPQHVDASNMGRACNTGEGQRADFQFMHQLLCCPISKVSNCNSLCMACEQKCLSLLPSGV